MCVSAETNSVRLRLEVFLKCLLADQFCLLSNKTVPPVTGNLAHGLLFYGMIAAWTNNHLAS
jgi:hypothetical protein